MSKIQVLDKYVSELIAAGEVVERPSSVIKELVENSIDAGSSVITVEIHRGGITFMRVTDNGSGIDKEDVPVALLRHATSKVHNSTDLDSIGTLGFRGEALASISAVSHMEIITKSQSDSIGTRVECSGGEISDVSDAGCPNGTTIIVRDLFYNTPARMKFMKKDVTEGNSIAGILDKIALSHPEISVRLIRDGRETLHSPGDNTLKSAIYAVFGKEFSSSLIPVNYSLGGIDVKGYTSLPTSPRPNRTMQNFFINGRWVKSRTAFVALEEAYKGSVMVGKFPACVLHLSMNFNSVDVNVHPAKLEIRFANEKPVFDAIYHAVKSALNVGDKPKEMPINTKYVSPFAGEQQVYKQVTINVPAPNKEVKTEFTPQPVQSSTESYVEKVKKAMFLDTEKEITVQNTAETSIESIIDAPVVPVTIKEQPVAEEHIEVINEENTNAAETYNAPQEIPESISSKIIGEAFDTYIIIQYGANKLMLIDKHAAHERLLYEKLKKQGIGNDAQSLLSPVPVTLEKNDYNSVINNLEKFSNAGFEIDDFGGGTVLVRTCPIALEGKDVADSVAEIANYLTDLKPSMSTEYLDWIYHNVACRAAIKGGNKNSPDELIALAKQLEENPKVRYCPHGRPVYLIIKKQEIEKQFGRI